MPELLNKIKTGKAQIHPPAKSIDEIEFNNLIGFKSIAHEIKRVCDCNVYAYGSRVNGNYHSGSDYDIMVYCEHVFKSTISNKIFSFKADIHFTNKKRHDLIEL